MGPKGGSALLIADTSQRWIYETDTIVPITDNSQLQMQRSSSRPQLEMSKCVAVVKLCLVSYQVELWGKEAPLAVRNFLALSMEGYYDGVIFHRIVPGFIVQTGDPTGTGMGGESFYGEPFKDEFHQRLKFNRSVKLTGCVISGDSHQPWPAWYGQ